ncbi:MAG: polyprenyl diphosphate synthase, partial [Nocardioides sp.]
DAVTDLAAQQRWRLHPVGALDLLPGDTARRLKEAADSTRDVDGMIVNIAVGYGGRREIADAVRSLLQEHAAKGTSIEELAEVLDVEHIAEHLYTKGQPDPDLVIRTSGEQRLGGFLLWQSAHSEFYFCEAYWPDFRRVDFLRALRAYADRERRFGA